MQACGEDGQVWVGQELIEKLRAQSGHHLHRAGQRRAQQSGKPGPFSRRGLGEQFLELVHHEQQVRASGPGRGQQQVVGELGQPSIAEPAADVGR
jgi:hypothetical protein